MHDEHEALRAGLEAWGVSPDGPGEAAVDIDALDVDIDTLDDVSLRPLRDMASMPWVRVITYRTMWSTATGADSAFTVTIAANETTGARGIFDWVAQGTIAGEQVSLTGQRSDSPVAAYVAAQRAIVEWFNGVTDVERA